MGGLGSRRRGWKPKAEHLLQVDIRAIHKENPLREGQSLCVSHPDATSGININLTWTALNYGGRRPWFICPSCGGRVAILYLHDREFKCRCCHDVTYIARCNQRSLDALLINEDKLLAKFRGAFPFRPRHMHMNTYIKLSRDYIGNAKTIDGYLDKQFGI